MKLDDFKKHIPFWGIKKKDVDEQVKKAKMEVYCQVTKHKLKSQILQRRINQLENLDKIIIKRNE